MFCLFGLGLTAASSPGLFGVLNLEPHEISEEILEKVIGDIEELEENLEDTKSDLEGNIEDLEGNIENLEQEMEELSDNVGNVFVLEGENPVCPGDSVTEEWGGPYYQGDNMIMRYFESKHCSVGVGGIGCGTGEKWSLSVPSCLYGGDNQNTCTADSWTKVLCKSDDN